MNSAIKSWFTSDCSKYSIARIYQNNLVEKMFSKYNPLMQPLAMNIVRTNEYTIWANRLSCERSIYTLHEK